MFSMLCFCLLAIIILAYSSKQVFYICMCSSHQADCSYAHGENHFSVTSDFFTVKSSFFFQVYAPFVTNFIMFAVTSCAAHWYSIFFPSHHIINGELGYVRRQWLGSTCCCYSRFIPILDLLCLHSYLGLDLSLFCNTPVTTLAIGHCLLHAENQSIPNYLKLNMSQALLISQHKNYLTNYSIKKSLTI